MFQKGDRVIVRDDWEGAGRLGQVIGPEVKRPDQVAWTPVFWDGEEDPDWTKTAAIRLFVEKEFKSYAGWAIVDRETTDISQGKIYGEEQEVNDRYKCIPVTVMRR